MRPKKYKTIEEKKAAQRAAAKRWRDKPGNAEKHRLAVKECRKKPHAKDAHRKRQLIYAARNRKQEARRTAKWRKDNPEKSRQLGRNRQARKRAGGGKIRRTFILALYVLQDGKCLTCKADFQKTGYEIDHVTPLSKGGEHAEWNVQLLCPKCNRRKSAKEMKEFLAILEAENAKR